MYNSSLITKILYGNRKNKEYIFLKKTGIGKIFFLLQKVQIGYGAHLASYLLGTEIRSRV